MHWASLDDFLAMGGYAYYVWFSFGLTLACMGLELWQLRVRKQNLTRGMGT